MRKIAMLVIAALVFAGAPVFALDAPIDEGLASLADQKTYGLKAPGMLLHGVYSVAEAPLEPLHQPMDRTFSKGDHAFGLLRGINRGGYNMMRGLTVGTFNILRAFVPGMGRYQGKDEQSKLLPDHAE